MPYMLNPFSGSYDYYKKPQATTSGGAVVTMAAENFTLDSTDISNKYIDLSNTPNSDYELLIFVEGGMKGVLNTDYIVLGKQIGWNGKGWDGLLEVGEIINTSYWY